MLMKKLIKDGLILILIMGVIFFIGFLAIKRGWFKMERILELKNISKSYKNKAVLTNVSLSIYQGEIYGLLCKNGIGKTTPH